MIHSQYIDWLVRTTCTQQAIDSRSDRPMPGPIIPRSLPSLDPLDAARGSSFTAGARRMTSA